MGETNAASVDEPFFSALLMPHRSLGRAGFAVLMGEWWLVGHRRDLCLRAHGRFSAFLGWMCFLIYVAFRFNYPGRASAGGSVGVAHQLSTSARSHPAGKAEAASV